MNIAASHISALSPRPGLGRSLLAIGCGALVLLLTWAMLVFGSVYRQQDLHDQLFERLNAKAFAQSKDLLKKYLEQPRIFRFLYPSQLIRRPAPSTIDGALANEIVGLLSALDANNLTLAQQHFDSLVGIGARLPQFSQTIVAMKGLLNSSKHINELQTRVAETETQLNSALAEGRLLARDFSEIFALEPVDLGASEFPPLYGAGVLSGLPKLKGLRDNIGDLARLQIELEGLKTSVKVAGENKHLAFMERIQKLRSALASASARFELQDRQHSEAKDQLDTLSAATKPIRQSLSKHLAAILEQALAAPNLW